MEEKSKQQLVFDWLLKNPEILHGSDNTDLYKEFENSGLNRNRLRSYKSRLKEKIEAGEIEEKELPIIDENEEQEERVQLDIKLGSILKGFLIFIGFLMIIRFFKKIFS